MKTAKKTPAPAGELRALLESLSIDKAALVQRVDDLLSVNKSHEERRQELRASIDGYQKAEKSMKDSMVRLTADNEKLRDELAHQERLVITMRAEAVVHRARGYIAASQGEPFEGPLVMREQSVSCDMADVAGGEPVTGVERYPGKAAIDRFTGRRNVMSSGPIEWGNR